MNGHIATLALPADFAQFLDDHPAISPVLSGDNAVLCGFQVGECFLSIEDALWLVATRPTSPPNQSSRLVQATGEPLLQSHSPKT